MKIRVNSGMFVTAATCIMLMMVLANCTNQTEDKSCDGYTGKITDKRSLALVNKCHFLHKDSIEQWTKKYEEYKQRIGNKKDSITGMMDKMSAGFLGGSSVSFNSCIVKKILCDKNSIGLRILYGIGSDNRIHIILVGIQPDYSNLYVDARNECCSSMSNARAVKDTSAHNWGGAEYGQMP